MRCQLRSFPDRAFGDFTVTHQHIGVVRQLVDISAVHGDAGADAQPLAERAGRRFSIGEARSRVSFEGRAHPAVCEQFLLRQDAGGCIQRIEQR